tara:strand:- start:249 stop:581 length:333 start_codon:yes stop_codon:yes gene_type:complete
MPNYEETDESDCEDPEWAMKCQYDHNHKWAGYEPIMEDTGEACDESLDPKYIKQILATYEGEVLLLRDSKRNEYEVVDGKAVMIRKFISWEKGFELCCGDEFVECDENDC